MSQRRKEYKKFPKGGTCEHCSSRSYYLEDDGFSYCKTNDHQQTTRGMQVERDEDDWNSQGKKTRTKKEVQAKVVKMFSGKKARELFLLSWQLIVWKQAWWLTRPKEEGGAGLPGELELVIKGMMIQWLTTFVAADDDGTETEEGFSSQTEFESGDDTSGTERTGRSGRGKKPRINGPRLIETLALCYLGTVVMRLPVSIGQFYDWAEKEDIIYIRAIRHVQVEMKSKLPVYYQSALDTRSALKPDSLQKAVLRLVNTLSISRGITLPAINYCPLTFYHINKLGLPLEIYLATHRIATLLSINFTFPPASTTNISISLSPEIQLASLIIIATKLVFPFDSTPPRRPISKSDPAIFRMDWAAWRCEVLGHRDRGKKRGDGKGLVKGQEIRVTEEEAFRMNGREVDDYLDWYGRTFVEGDDEDQKLPAQILRLFPLNNPTPIPDPSQRQAEPISQATSSQPQEPHPNSQPIPSVQAPPATQAPSPPPKHEIIHNMQKYLKYQAPRDDDDDEGYATSGPPPEIRHTHYRSVSELPENARVFYEVVAKQTSTSLETLVHAVFSTERKLVKWMIAQRRKRLDDEYLEYGVSGEEDGEDGDDDGEEV